MFTCFFVLEQCGLYVSRETKNTKANVSRETFAFLVTNTHVFHVKQVYLKFSTSFNTFDKSIGENC